MAFHHASTEETHELAPNVSRRYAWVVFALTFGLLISDYMSRQVLNAVFPMLKAEWGLSDSQLGGLSGVVALMVGLLTFPLSLMADRWGRVRSLALMAALWSLATLACGISQNFNQMFLARFFVGVGEAAYGSVGIAVVLSVFPSHMRASLIGAFMAGGMLGSVLGMASGGILATHFGWRGSFVGIAVFGLLLSIIYPLVVKQKRIDAKSVSGMEEQSAPAASTSQRPTLASLYSTRSVIAIYFGSGLQLFVTSALIAWMPSFLNRYYSMSPDRAGVMAAGFVLSIGIGMVICGMLCDRLCRHAPERKMALAIAFCLSCCVLLSIAFNLPNGNAQLLLIVIGMFFAAGTGGTIWPRTDLRYSRTSVSSIS